MYNSSSIIELYVLLTWLYKAVVPDHHAVFFKKCFRDPGCFHRGALLSIRDTSHFVFSLQKKVIMEEAHLLLLKALHQKSAVHTRSAHMPLESKSLHSFLSTTVAGKYAARKRKGFYWVAIGLCHNTCNMFLCIFENVWIGLIARNVTAKFWYVL